MKKSKIQNVALLAMMAALTEVSTMFLKLPQGLLVANGYVNLGDTLLMLAAFLLGPLAGFTAGSLGSALADLVSGCAIYAPITFIVKGLEGLICGLIYKKMKRKYALLAALPAGLFMVFGYFIGEIFLYGVEGALASIFGNTVQGVVNAVLAVLLNEVLKKTPVKYLNN